MSLQEYLVADGFLTFAMSDAVIDLMVERQAHKTLPGFASGHTESIDVIAKARFQVETATLICRDIARRRSTAYVHFGEHAEVLRAQFFRALADAMDDMTSVGAWAHEPLVIFQDTHELHQATVPGDITATRLLTPARLAGNRADELPTEVPESFDYDTLKAAISEEDNARYWQLRRDLEKDIERCIPSVVEAASYLMSREDAVAVWPHLEEAYAQEQAKRIKPARFLLAPYI